MSENTTVNTEDTLIRQDDGGEQHGAVDPATASGVAGVMKKLQQGPEFGEQDLERILDIPVQLSVEIGRTRTSIKQVLQLAQGSVVELDAVAGAPMDVLINGYLIAQGEVVVVNDRFGIRLTDIVTPAERMRRLNRN